MDLPSFLQEAAIISTIVVWSIAFIIYLYFISIWVFDFKHPFYRLRPEEYEMVAREAHAKYFIDLSLSMTKGLTLTFFILPITIIFKNSIEKGQSTVLKNLLNSIPYSLIVFMTVAFILSIVFKQYGLKHLNEIEKVKNKVPSKEE
jgi:amino acid transporter